MNQLVSNILVTHNLMCMLRIMRTNNLTVRFSNINPKLL